MGSMNKLPILSIRGRILFPNAFIRISVGRESTARLIRETLWGSFQHQKPALLAIFTEHAKALGETGTVARVVQLIKTSSTNSQFYFSMLVQGIARVRIVDIVQQEPYVMANVKIHKEPLLNAEADQEILNEYRTQLKKMVKLLMQENLYMRNREIIDMSAKNSLGEMIDLVVSNLTFTTLDKQQILDSIDLKERLKKGLELMEKHNATRKHRPALKNGSNSLNDELSIFDRKNNNAISNELMSSEIIEKNDESDLDQVVGKIKKMHFEPKVDRVIKRELRKLKKMNPSQPEYNIYYSYLELVADLPWNIESVDNLNVDAVRKQLDLDHFGIENVKKRIIEYIAVRQLTKSLNGPILCLVGPPGVGKTSLGKSIALATNRKFERIALGGVHDESEIRGHRKTYIGAMPGSIISAIRKVETRNPVILLDEIDKISQHANRGDPSNALLEVLDPHQNDHFMDHYLNVPFNLNQVLFIATANSLDTIPKPLLDRMEIINMEGYNVNSKIQIGTKYLIPYQVKMNGLTMDQIDFNKESLEYLVLHYTRESGVRTLERQVGAICRHIAVNIVNTLNLKPNVESIDRKDENIQAKCGTKKDQNREITTCKSEFNETCTDKKVYTITPDLIRDVLGMETFRSKHSLRISQPGIATGMAWSEYGGSILFVEATCIRQPRKGEQVANQTLSTLARHKPDLFLTGTLGDVMKESAQVALTLLRVHFNEIHSAQFENITEFHLHFPEGATPKDGPSAGITVFCALVSLVTNIPVPIDLSMTGEITLRGVVLPVGGIKEKVLAASRAGIKRVILPKENRLQAEEMKTEFEGIEIIYVSDVKQLLQVVFHIDWNSSNRPSILGKDQIENSVSNVMVNPIDLSGPILKSNI